MEPRWTSASAGRLPGSVMAGEGRRTTLGEAAHLLTGFPFKSADFSDAPDDVRLLRGDNIAQGTVRWDGVKRWPRTRMNDHLDYLLRPGDVALAMDRPWIEAGLKHATLTEADCPSLLVQRVARLRARPGVEQRFLGYVVRSPAFTHYVLGVQTGTAVPHISGGQIKSYGFVLPPLAEQQQTAELLGALDDKIELNRRMAETLEAMTQALFKSWFVDFDPVRAKADGRPTGLPNDLATLFPDSLDHQGVPVGWHTQRLGDLFDVVGGNTPRTESAAFWGGTHHWATPKDLSRVDMLSLLDTGRRLTIAGLQQASSGLLPIGSLLLSTRAPIGYMAFITRPMAINQGLAAITRKDVSAAYAWGWCHANMDVIVRNAGGSTFPEISKAVLRTLPMLAPSQPVLDAFGSVADEFIRRIVTAAEQARTLIGIRDTLLPKLMSGELRIADAEQQTAAA